MQFGLTEEQDMIVSTVRSFVEKEIYPHEDMVERTGQVPRELGQEIKKKVIDLGFYACNFPQEVGGAGLGWREGGAERRLVEEGEAGAEVTFDDGGGAGRVQSVDESRGQVSADGVGVAGGAVDAKDVHAYEV